MAIGISYEFLLIANKKNQIYRWIFRDPESTKQMFPIPFSSPERINVSKIFCDSKGLHSIIFLSNASTRISYYFHIKTQKFKELTKLKDINVESIAWDDTYSTDYSTNVKYNNNRIF